MIKAIKPYKPYKACYPDPLILKVDESIRILKSEKKSSKWFGWHLCLDQNGKEGWISLDFMTIDDHKGKIVKAYTAKELDAQKGQEFKVIGESYGWYWCLNDNNEEGWLPKNIFIE